MAGDVSWMARSLMQNLQTIKHAFRSWLVKNRVCSNEFM